MSVTDPKALPYLLTVKEVADLLRTTERAIYLKAQRGLLPGIVRDGRRLLLRRDDVLEYIAGRRASSPGDRR